MPDPTELPGASRDNLDLGGEQRTLARIDHRIWNDCGPEWRRELDLAGDTISDYERVLCHSTLYCLALRVVQ